MKNKSFFVYNKKGAQTKTTIAILLAKYFGADFYTNDIGNSTIEIYAPLFKGKDQEFRELKPGEEIQIDDEKPNVFDFGGFLDERMIEVAKFVDWCVVPLSFQSSAELIPTIQTIKSLEKYNKKIVIVINNTEKDYVEPVRESLAKQFKHPIFIINKSKFFTRLADENKTIFDLSEEKSLKNRIINGGLVKQLDSLCSFLGK